MATEPDINDIFDDIFLTEERLTENGYKIGYADGAGEGNPDGYHLGYHRGAEIGAELGFYYGFITYHIQLTTDERKRKLLHDIQLEIDQFPRQNDENVDLFGRLDSIRAKYRKVCAQLKVNGRYPDGDQLTF